MRDRGLSSLALLWVLEGAKRQGLAVDPEVKAELAREADPMGPLVPYWQISSPVSWLRALTATDREGPDRGDAEALSDALALRWRRDPSYRPRALLRVRDLLDPVARGAEPEGRRPTAPAPRETAEA